MYSVFNKYALIILTLGFTMMASQSSQTQLLVQSDDLLAFAANHHSKQEIADQITKVLVENRAKAKIRYEKQKIALETIDLHPFAANQFEFFLSEYYFHQKQIELLRWQYKKAEGDEARRLAMNNLVAVYVKQEATAKKLAQMAASAFEFGRCTMKDYLECENNLDQTRLDLLNFMLLTQME